MTVQELYDRLGDLVRRSYGDCDIKVETNESDRQVASLQADVTDTEGDGFPFVLVRLEWDVPGTHGAEAEWRDQ